MASLKIAYRNIADLRPRSGNPRTHSKRQIEQIAASILRFGFTNPVLIDQNDGVLAGHGRLQAAKTLDMSEVPTLRLADLNEAEIRAYVIADNRLAEKAGWDQDLLGLEFKYLAELDFDFDLTLTGFDLPEIDAMISGIGNGDAAPDPADEIPEPQSGPSITRPGDIWLIGPHRLICGDATSPDTYAALLGDERAGLVFTDPPYNVPISGHVSGLGKAKHREFAMASGEMTEEGFRNFLAESLGACANPRTGDASE